MSKTTATNPATRYPLPNKGEFAIALRNCNLMVAALELAVILAVEVEDGRQRWCVVR
jgi:hypothetical protein